MPSLSSPTDTLVLVTGANGYVAAHVVRELLEHGYRVRGTVRALSKAAHLQDIFRQYGDKLEFVVINDMMNVCNTFARSCPTLNIAL
jgi:nucleoside-diphosphate-sugar epimerase